MKRRAAAVFLVLILLLSVFPLPAFADGPAETPPTEQPSDIPSETTAPAPEPTPEPSPAFEPTPMPSYSPTPQPEPEPSETPNAVPESQQVTMVDGRECVDGEVLIKFKDDSNSPGALSMLESVGSEISEQLEIGDIVLSDVPEGETVESFIDVLEEQPNIEFVQPNYIYHIDQAVNASYAYSNYQWYLNTIGVFDAWDITMGSPNIRVAVIDTGVDLSHPEFAGQIVAQTNCINPALSAADDNGHGTHVAGTIAARADNGIGIAGVAPGVKLIIAKALDSEGIGNDADIIEGIYYAVSQGARVINMSFGGTEFDPAEETAINYAVNAGVVCVAAAGNQGFSDYYAPSDFEACISVIATDEKDEITYFSNYGSAKDISAPGDWIYSTIYDRYNPYNNYGYLSGTSMAAPMVAATAALVLSVNPNLTVAQVKDILYTTSIDLGDPGKDDYYGNGRLCAAAALLKASGRTLFSGGSGTESDPYHVSSPEGLNAVRYFEDANFILTSDIEMMPATSAGGKYYYFGRGWDPIEVLHGSFNGNGHIINGLIISEESKDNKGLFHTVAAGATVSNLNLTNCNIIGSNYVGGIASINNGSITNSTVTGKITGIWQYVGGITAFNNGTVSQCENSAAISTGYCLGGIAGKNNGNIANCRNYGNISSNRYSIGGIAGDCDGRIQYCFNSANVKGQDYTGGIAGYFRGNVDYCYNTGNINATEDAGGIIGEMTFGQLTNCFNTGMLSASSYAGGIIGYCSSGSMYYCYNTGNCGIVAYMPYGAAPTACYYLNRGSTFTYGTSKTLEELRRQATFSGFNFTGTWDIVEGERFPVLRAVPFTYTQDMALDREVLKIRLGLSDTIGVWFAPANASNKSMVWTTSDASVATVSNGTVTLHKDSTAVIKATSADGGFTDTCTVMILPEYTIYFDAQGGSYVPSAVITEGSSLYEPAAPSRPGYTFGGWFPTPACDTAPVSFPYPVYGGRAFYAKWYLNCTVWFNTQGGSPVASATLFYSSAIPQPAAPARSGYAFAGWYREPECITAWNFSADTIKQDMALYAKWQFMSPYLVNVGLSSGYINRGFSPAVTSYKINIGEYDSSFTLTAFREYDGAAMTMNKQNTSSITVYPANGKSAKITVKVTYGRKSKTYTFTVTRAKSTNNYLGSLSAGAGAWSQGFDPNVLNYTLYLDENTKSTAIKASAVAGTGAKVSPASAKVTLNNGAYKDVKITVTAQSGAKRVYTIHVVRAASTNAGLKSLKAPGLRFNAAQTNYTVILPANKSTFSISAKAAGYKAMVSINGGKASAKVPLVNGETKIVRVVVTAQAGNTKEYLVTVTRL